MRRRIPPQLAVLLLSTACVAPPPDYVTPLGIEVYVHRASPDSGFWGYPPALIDDTARIVRDRLEWHLEAFDGLPLHLYETYPIPGCGPNAAGCTVFDGPTKYVVGIHVWQRSSCPDDSALPHEFIHVWHAYRGFEPDFDHERPEWGEPQNEIRQLIWLQACGGLRSVIGR